MTVRERLALTEERLQQGGFIPYKFEARQLLAFAIRTSSDQLWTIAREEMGAEAEAELEAALARRMGGEPLQYILGEWEFYSLPFKVGPGVLIPRGDTELLVDNALEFLRGKEAADVADLCSGSGCIAIAVSKKRPDCKVSAFELSPDAIGYLQQNNSLNGTNVNIIHSDITKDFCADMFDIILSNPPYIETETINELDEEVKREPFMALDGGNDGLDFYRLIAEKWSRNLKRGGALMVEIGINQHSAVSEIFRAAGLENIKQVKDINEIERVIIGTMPL